MTSKLCNTIANIKLGLKTKRLSVRVHNTKFLRVFLQRLIDLGYLRGFSVIGPTGQKLQVYLKYDENFSPVIKELTSISKSSKRVYFTFNKILNTYSRGEIYLISTSFGLLSSSEIVYNRLNVGGEVLTKISFF